MTLTLAAAALLAIVAYMMAVVFIVKLTVAGRRKYKADAVRNAQRGMIFIHERCFRDSIDAGIVSEAELRKWGWRYAPGCGFWRPYAANTEH